MYLFWYSISVLDSMVNYKVISTLHCGAQYKLLEKNQHLHQMVHFPHFIPAHYLELLLMCRYRDFFFIHSFYIR